MGIRVCGAEGDLDSEGKEESVFTLKVELDEVVEYDRGRAMFDTLARGDHSMTVKSAPFIECKGDRG